MTYKKKLIEVALPLEAINKAAAREKSVHHQQRPESPRAAPLQESQNHRTARRAISRPQADPQGGRCRPGPLG